MTELRDPGRDSVKRSYKIDAPLAEFAYERRENRLTERVAEAREMGMSYGKYMAMLHDGLIADPQAKT